MLRIFKYSRASPCCLIVMLIYLDRFKSKCPSVTLTSTTMQRLLLVAAMTATKYLEDVCCNNRRW
jgi:hypothetical protein